MMLNDCVSYGPPLLDGFTVAANRNGASASDMLFSTKAKLFGMRNFSYENVNGYGATDDDAQ